MDTLPPEVKRLICSNLTPEDLKAVRLTNRDLATAGACYILPTFYVFNCPESFEDLEEIINHPTFSKHLETIVLDVALLPSFGDDFLAWNKYRRCHDFVGRNKYGPGALYIPRWIEFEPTYQSEGPDGRLDARSQKALLRAQALYEAAVEECPVSVELAHEMWHNYQWLVDVQKSQEFMELKRRILSSAFLSCPNLERLDVSQTSPLFAGKRNCMFSDVGGEGSKWWTGSWFGSYHVFNNDTFAAQVSNGGKLRHLTFINPRYCQMMFGTLLSIPLQDLHTIHLSISADLHATLHAAPGLLDAEANKADAFAQSLCTARHLQSLRLDLSMDSDDAPPSMRALAQRLIDAHFPHLHTLLVRWVDMSEDALVAFLIRHEKSLQNLAFTDCTLTDGTWTSLFARISTQLSVLKAVRLRGALLAQGDVDIECPYGEYTNINTMALQRFVIEGGPFPPTPVLSSDFTSEDLIMLQPVFLEEGEEGEEGAYLYGVYK